MHYILGADRSDIPARRSMGDAEHPSIPESSLALSLPLGTSEQSLEVLLLAWSAIVPTTSSKVSCFQRCFRS